MAMFTDAPQRPELYRAYIGVGQMVDPRATDNVFYRDSLAWARRTGQTTLAARLTGWRIDIRSDTETPPED